MRRSLQGTRRCTRCSHVQRQRNDNAAVLAIIDLDHVIMLCTMRLAAAAEGAQHVPGIDCERAPGCRSLAQTLTAEELVALDRSVSSPLDAAGHIVTSSWHRHPTHGSPHGNPHSAALPAAVPAFEPAAPPAPPLRGLFAAAVRRGACAGAADHRAAAQHQDLPASARADARSQAAEQGLVPHGDPAASRPCCRANTWHTQAEPTHSVSFSQAALRSLGASCAEACHADAQGSTPRKSSHADEVPVSFAPDAAAPVQACEAAAQGSVLQVRTPPAAADSHLRQVRSATRITAHGNSMAATPTTTGTKRCRSSVSRTASSPWMPAVQSAPPRACKRASYKCVPRRIKPTPVLEASAGTSPGGQSAPKRMHRLATPQPLPPPLKRSKLPDAGPPTAQARAVISGAGGMQGAPVP